MVKIEKKKLVIELESLEPIELYLRNLQQSFFNAIISREPSIKATDILDIEVLKIIVLNSVIVNMRLFLEIDNDNPKKLLQDIRLCTVDLLRDMAIEGCEFNNILEFLEDLIYTE